MRPLADTLAARFDVWYDDYELVVGASLLKEISKGLSATDYGVVVLSPYFFDKKWPQRELNGLFALEEKDRKVILPICVAKIADGTIFQVKWGDTLWC